jgi:hypothetical protein
MGLQDFVKSSEVAEGGESLSQRLLFPTIQISRVYSPVTARGRHLSYGATIGVEVPASMEPISDVVPMPYSVYLGIYGAGVIVLDGVEHPAIFCNEQLAPLTPKPLEELIDNPALSRVVREILSGDTPNGTVALGLKAPSPHFGPGKSVECGGRRGTLGAIVKTTAGATGLLTAGHVGGPLGAVAHCEGSAIGTVTYSDDPAFKPPNTVSADVAVITVNPSAIGSLSLPTQITGIAKVGPSDRVESHCVTGCNTTGILGKAPWIFIPQMAGLWADVYLTHSPISVAGDSGAPVFLQGTNKIVGHVVGGAPGMLTFVQEIDCQLSACGCMLYPP